MRFFAVVAALASGAAAATLNVIVGANNGLAYDPPSSVLFISFPGLF